MAISNQEMRRALTIVIELAQAGVLRDTVNDPMLVAERNKQLKAIELVEHLKTLMFVHHLTRTKENNDAD